ncbi:MAG TPA: RDD family protein [Candidatus Limnocylindria bacterium]|nr:RDD family protein [Candidatus Limnocylindria bacterium]
MSDEIIRVGEPRAAGFWIRAAALVIDLVIVGFVKLSLELIAGRRYGAEVEQAWSFQTTIVLFTLLFTAAYTTLLHTWLGQTVGKSVVGVRVIAADGRGLDGNAAFLRYLGYYVSMATFGFGYLMAALRRDKRALHDLIAGSRVEHVRPEA